MLQTQHRSLATVCTWVGGSIPLETHSDNDYQLQLSFRRCSGCLVGGSLFPSLDADTATTSLHHPHLVIKSFRQTLKRPLNSRPSRLQPYAFQIASFHCHPVSSAGAVSSSTQAIIQLPPSSLHPFFFVGCIRVAAAIVHLLLQLKLSSSCLP